MIATRQGDESSTRYEFLKRLTRTREVLVADDDERSCGDRREVLGFEGFGATLHDGRERDSVVAQ